MGITQVISSGFVFAATLFAVSFKAAAQNSSLSASPQFLSYQGYLTDLTGLPVADGEYLVTMRLYDVAEGGKPLWEEELRVSAYGGFFETYLGVRKPLNLPFDRQYWLAAQVRGEPEMTPRTLLALAPYAFRSIYAEKAAGLVPNAEGAVTGLNGAQGEVTIVGTGGIRVSRSGDTITVSAEALPAGASGSAGNTSGMEPVKITAGKEVKTDAASGVITLGLGGEELTARPPVAGSFQHLGAVVVYNPYVTDRSIIHVTVLEKKDEGTAPSPETGLYLVDVDNRTAGSFMLHIGMVPTFSSSTSFQKGDSISIGYTIVNPSR